MSNLGLSEKPQPTPEQEKLASEAIGHVYLCSEVAALLCAVEDAAEAQGKDGEAARLLLSCNPPDPEAFLILLTIHFLRKAPHPGKHLKLLAEFVGRDMDFVSGVTAQVLTHVHELQAERLSQMRQGEEEGASHE